MYSTVHVGIVCQCSYKEPINNDTCHSTTSSCMSSCHKPDRRGKQDFGIDNQHQPAFYRSRPSIGAGYILTHCVSKSSEMGCHVVADRAWLTREGSCSLMLGSLLSACKTSRIYLGRYTEEVSEADDANVSEPRFEPTRNSTNDVFPNFTLPIVFPYDV